MGCAGRFLRRFAELPGCQAVIGFALLSFMPVHAWADVQYCYQGYGFTTKATGAYNSKDKLNGCLTLTYGTPLGDSPLTNYTLTLDDASFSDGVQNISGVTTFDEVAFATAGGEVSQWVVILANASNSAYIETANAGVLGVFDTTQNIAGDIGLSSAAGSWTITREPPQVPEPRSLVLMLTLVVAFSVGTTKRWCPRQASRIERND